MATKSTSSPTENVSNVEATATLLLEREELRRKRAKRRTKRRRQAQRQEDRGAVQQMHRSIEVIKFCIVGICAVWVISFIISLVVLVKVNNKVSEIEVQVKRIQYVMENPFASAGTRLGAGIDQKLKQYLRLPEPQEAKE